MARIVSIDWVPRYRDAGYDNLINSLAPNNYDGNTFLQLLNEGGSQPDVNLAMLWQYISDVQNDGGLQIVEVYEATLPPPIVRPVAPGGIGQDAAGIFFSTPTSGTYTVRFYVNGTLTYQEQKDLSADRSIAKATLGAQVGDVVQIALVDNEVVVGWWGRVVIE